MPQDKGETGRKSAGSGARGRPTLKEIAHRAGVSVSTVSLVLSGKSAERRISAEAERRVREVARECDYAPNLLVRSLQRGRTHVLSFYSAFHHREAGDLYMDRLTSGVERASGARHYDVLVHCSRHRSPEETYQFLNGGLSDGVLFFGPERDDDLIPLLRDSRLPTVLLGYADRDSGLARVSDDMADGIRQIADTLIELGHRRIAAISGGPWSDAAVRIAALRAELAWHGVLLPDSRIIPVYQDGPTDADTALARLLSRPEPPTALYCWHDRVGYEMLEACARRGVRIPQELSLIGYDGLHWPSTSPHLLASIRVDLEQIAAQAVTILDALIQGESDPPSAVDVPVTLDPGTTLAAAAAPPPPS